MKNLKIEGDLSFITETQQNFILKVLEERGYHNKKVTFSSLTKPGDNFMANVKRITVDNDDGTKFKMIAKTAAQDPMARQMMFTALAFKNEGNIYTKLFPKFAELEESTGVPPQERFRHPECYGVLWDEPQEVILLEDLAEPGYEMLNKFNPLTNETVKLTLDNLAHYHALSYVWKNEDIESYDALKEKFFNSWMQIPAEDSNNEFFQPLESQVLSWLEDQQLKKKYECIFTKMVPLVTDLYIKDKDSKYSVIQQGDAWTNNLMFKIKDSIPQSCILIDYQMAKPNKPAADLLFLLLTSTVHDQRAEHLEDWISFYHGCLHKYLSNFGLSVADVLPREQLNAEIKEHAEVSLRLALIINLFTLREASEALDLKNMEKDNVAKTLGDSGKLDVKLETLNRLKDRALGMFKTVTELDLFTK